MKRSISQVCIISLKSSVFLHPKTTKCTQVYDKVCANIIQLKTNLKLIAMCDRSETKYCVASHAYSKVHSCIINLKISMFCMSVSRFSAGS